MAQYDKTDDSTEPRVFDATAKSCPTCGTFSMGWPVKVEGGYTTEQWPEPWRWTFRMDLHDFICACCHQVLGLDPIRAKLMRDMDLRTALVPRTFFQQFSLVQPNLHCHP